MSKLLIAVFAAVAVVSACATDTGIGYTASKLNIAGQGEAHRVTCSGIFESQNTCMSKAANICQDRQVVAIQALDNPQMRQGGSSAREFNFACAGASRPPA
jgi:hypothetical protein